ncbi:cytochrome P450, partial [Marasmius fiardii PR-910]
TATSLETFFLAVALHPESQKRAHRELDSVLGKGRLPTWADRSDLPCVEAIVCETLRCVQAFPLGIFHATVQEDTIDGHFVPKS